MPPAPALPEGPWQVVASGTNTAWAGPWGVSFTANLTPDAETGLGKWTERDFIATIRTGRHMGRGRAGAAADADPGLQQLQRPRPEGDLRVPADDSAGASNRVPEPQAPR